MSKVNFVEEYVTPFIKEDLVPLVINIAIAVVVFWIGSMIIKKIKNVALKRMEKKEVDPTLRPFLSNILTTILKVILVITVIGILGIPTTSFAAILAAAGLAVGMALSGTLQNFAGGVMILIFKPFKVGDLVEAQGYTGIVKEISLFVTILTTLDNKTIILPNGPLSNGAMVNYSTEDLRRVDWAFGIGYGDDTTKAREVILKAIKEDDRILTSPEQPFIEVAELADSSVNFAVRVWVKQADYWGVYFRMNEKIYNDFNTTGLNIPYPQMDVHIHNEK